MMSETRESYEKWESWKHNTPKFAHDVFAFKPDNWQLEAFQAWDNPAIDRIAMQACAGPGKTAVEAICAWQFLVCRSDGINHPQAFAMSITGDNLRDNLWKELAIWYGRSQFLQRAFIWQKEQIFNREFPDIWWLRARSWSKSADPEAQGRTLSGLHAKSIAYFIDEGGEIPPSVGRSAEQGLSNCEWGKILMAGNASSHDGLLYLAANTQSHLWKVIPVTGDPDDPARSPRIDIEWAREQIALYGRDNPWVMAFILGKFPPTSINALLSPDEVRQAMDRRLADHEYINLQKRLGVDVARFGDDRTVLFPRQGRRAYDPVEMRNARTDAIAGRVALAKKNWQWELGFIDSTGGYSGGVEDQSRLGGIELIPVNFSSNALDPRYFNRRSEMHFLAAEWVKNGGWLPNKPSIIREACAARYWFDKGKLRVTEKDQIKKDLQGHSPDDWDAFILTFALPDMPASVEQMLGIPGFHPNERNKVNYEWDPLEDRRSGVLT
jgi:phage terminase large subunit